MIDYDDILIIITDIDTPHGDMMSKEASTLQLIRNKYLIKVLKFDKQAKWWDYAVSSKGALRN